MVQREDEVTSPIHRPAPGALAERGAPRRVLRLSLLPKGAQRGEKVYRLDKARISLGSVVSADVRLSGHGVAPIHAVIEYESGDGPDAEGDGPSAWLFDLASESGVYVNGSKTVSHALAPGDEITLGLHTLRFDFEVTGGAGAGDSSSSSSEGDPAYHEAGDRRLYLPPGEDLVPLLLESDRDVEEIFDYRPSSQLALEVVMAWHDTVLEVEHFTRDRMVTIGGSHEDDFAIPPLMAERRFPLVVKGADGYYLNLHPQIRGVVQKGGPKGGTMLSLDELKTSALVSKSGERPRVPLGKDDYAKVSIGEIDFYLSYTAAPPRLRRQRLLDRDPFFLKVWFASLAFTIAGMATLSRMEVPPQVEAEKLPDRIATILYAPEKYQYVKPPEKKALPKPEPTKEPVAVKPPPKPKPTPVATRKLEIQPKPVSTPKPVPTEMQVAPPKPVPTQTKAPTPPKPVSGPSSNRSENVAKQGEGAKAKGATGTRGQKSAPKASTHQDRAKRPSPQGGTGPGGGQSQVAGEGNVDFLAGEGAKIQNLLGNAGQQLGKGGDKLKGFGGFTTQGAGGLALSGSGQGGGGDAASLGGLGNKGIGGGKVGTGLGAAGSGSGIAGGKTRVTIRTGGPEEAVVMGAIDAEAVEAALLAHRDEFRNCYEREINAENPTLGGRVGTTFVIGATGRVGQSGIESSSLKNANVERCVLKVIGRIQFPIPRGGGVVQVSYPFKFAPLGK